MLRLRRFKKARLHFSFFSLFSISSIFLSTLETLRLKIRTKAPMMTQYAIEATNMSICTSSPPAHFLILVEQPLRSSEAVEEVQEEEEQNGCGG